MITFAKIPELILIENRIIKYGVKKENVIEEW